MNDLMETAWDSGSYAEVAPRYLEMAGQLVADAPIHEGTPVLDVGCGTGNVAISAARAGAEVTGLDVTPDLLATARENAKMAGFEDIQWREADAADLPFADDRFEVTLSNLGHMYATPPDSVTAELARVTEAGGTIGFTAWTPSSLFPTMAQTFLPYLGAEDLPEISAPPPLWGSPDIVRDRLTPAVENLQFERDLVEYPALSPTHFLNETLTTSGVFSELLGRVDDPEIAALRSDLLDVTHGSFAGNKNTVELEYVTTTGTVSNQRDH